MPSVRQAGNIMMLLFIAPLSAVACDSGSKSDVAMEPPTMRAISVSAIETKGVKEGELYAGATHLGTLVLERDAGVVPPLDAEVEPSVDLDAVPYVLKVPTPCGTYDLPMKLMWPVGSFVPSRGGTDNVSLAFVDSFAPKAWQIYLDGVRESQVVVVGKTAVTHGSRLYDWGCADAHAVTLDGEEIAQVSGHPVLPPASPDLSPGAVIDRQKRFEANPGLLITARTNACYRVRSLNYGMANQSEEARILKDAQAYILYNGAEFFLKPAPSSVTAWKTDINRRLDELQSTDCPEE